MVRRTPVAAALFVICGAVFGWGLAGVGERLALRRGPPGWELRWPPVPTFPAIPQPLPEGGAWPLGNHGELVSRGERGAVDLAVEVPPGGRFEVSLEGRGGGALGLILARTGEPSSRVWLRDAGEPAHWASCDAELPAPAEGPLPVHLSLGGEELALSVAGAEASCPVGPLVNPRVHLRAGMLRVRLDAVDGVSAGTGGALRLGGALAGALGFGLLGWLLRRWRWAPLAALPLLLEAAVSTADAEALLQAVRIPAPDALRWLAGVPPALAGALALLGLVFEAGRRRWWPLGLFVAGGGGAAATFALGASGLLPCLAGAGAAVAGAVIVLVNARRVRGFNWLSLALVGLLLLLAEAALRGTATGNAWAGVSSRYVEDGVGQEDVRPPERKRGGRDQNKAHPGRAGAGMSGEDGCHNPTRTRDPPPVVAPLGALTGPGCRVVARKAAFVRGEGCHNLPWTCQRYRVVALATPAAGRRGVADGAGGGGHGALRRPRELGRMPRRSRHHPLHANALLPRLVGTPARHTPPPARLPPHLHPEARCCAPQGDS